MQLRNAAGQKKAEVSVLVAVNDIFLSLPAELLLLKILVLIKKSSQHTLENNR